MLFPGIKKIAKEKNWHRSGSMVAGLEKGYLVNMGDGAGFKFFLLPNLAVPGEKKAVLESEFSGMKKEFSFRDIIVEEDSLFISISESFLPAKRDKLLGALDKITYILKKHDIPANDTCRICQAAAGNSLHYLSSDDVNTNMCMACVESLRHDLRKEKDTYQNEDKNYLQGFLGAMLFSLPGVLVWILVAVYLDRIAAFVALLTFFLSMKGYEKFGGKRGRMYSWILLGVNALMVVVSNYATVAFLMYTKNNVPFREALLMMVKNPDLTAVIYKQIQISFAVCFLLWLFLLYSSWQGTRFPELHASVKIE